jgi:hypothetical protein
VTVDDDLAGSGGGRWTGRRSVPGEPKLHAQEYREYGFALSAGWS